MLGAVVGDVVGSIYEANNTYSKNFDMFSKNSRFTDDSVMTCAVAKACIEYSKNKDLDDFRDNVIKYMRELGILYINAGYGVTFIKWLLTSKPVPYNSWGNGSAMRVSPVAWVSETIEECESLAKISAEVTHNHPEGIKGAQAIASAVFMARNGYEKKDIKKYIEEKFYNLNFRLDDIRLLYKFDVSCQGSVPQAIEAFLEEDNFENIIRTSISIGGDSDTIAAMAGSIAEAYYGIPIEISHLTEKYLTGDLKKIIKDFDSVRKQIENVKNK